MLPKTLLLLALLGSVEDLVSKETPTVVEYHLWHDSEGAATARVLTISRFDGEVSTSWSLAETPLGNRAQVRSKVTWGEVGLEARYEDETSGWWAEYSLSTSLRDLDGLDPAGAVLAFEKIADGKESSHESFVTSDGYLWRRSSGDADPQGAEESFPAAFSGSTEAAAVPETSVESAGFLLKAREERQLRFGREIELVLHAIARGTEAPGRGLEPEFSTQSWVIRRGDDADLPKEVEEFISRFSGVSKTKMLGG